MGVQGLTTYVEGNRNFFQDVKFRDSRLVIDGCSLYFRLYFSHGLDQQHGGDYDAFFYLLSQFLSALAACSILPFVVLDGGMDPSDKKFSTLRQRLQSKIRDAESLSHGRHGSLLPILTREVFTQILSEKGIPFVQCPAEADWEIACLARQWNCPVLSNDSDFYIFDLPGGYLPLSFFNWTNLNGKAPHQYITARRYTTNQLCWLFGGMNRELLPLCAVLSGNDYGRPNGVDTLLALLDLAGPGGGGWKGTRKAPLSRIEGILLWLSSFTGPHEAVEEVARLMGESETDRGRRGKRIEEGKLSSQLWNGMQEYHIATQSSLSHWFSGGKVAPGNQRLEYAQVPECLFLAVAQGTLPPLVLDVVVLRRVLLIPQVENSKLASSHCSARAIRQAIYGILLQKGGLGQDTQIHGIGGSASAQHAKIPGRNVQVQDVRGQENMGQGKRGRRGHGGSQTGIGRGHDPSLPTQQGLIMPQTSNRQGTGAGALQAESSSAPNCVEEYDRLDLNLKRNQVEAYSLGTTLCPDTIGQAPLAVRLCTLLDILGVKKPYLAPIPPHLQLAVGVTCFWMKEASPPPSLPQLQALSLGIVYGELSWKNQSGVRQPKWAAEHSVWLGLNQVRLTTRKRRGMDVADAHSFSQWQACLWSTLCLNQLLMLPLPEPYTSWLFSGSLVHGLLRSLRGGRTPESFLVGGTLSQQLYCALLDAVKINNSDTPRSSSASGGRKRSGHRGRRRGGGGRGGGGRGDRGSEELNNKFALLLNE
ncbi:protein asteroid homolog 1 [Lampris incognitus]|uniref:protein asteroid homolog 1 n=1 Tax=Lampris incognitus TaxID=2546036 RepID=UPI0024B5423C|nr:protein asteroid homolog 1 [Lampris incognitus]